MKYSFVKHIWFNIICTVCSWKSSSLLNGNFNFCYRTDFCYWAHHRPLSFPTQLKLSILFINKNILNWIVRSYPYQLFSIKACILWNNYYNCCYKVEKVTWWWKMKIVYNMPEFDGWLSILQQCQVIRTLFFMVIYRLHLLLIS